MVIVSDEDSGCWCIALTKAFLSLQADEPIQNPSSLQGKANKTSFNISSCKYNSQKD
jgi:hypothetical protein